MQGEMGVNHKIVNVPLQFSVEAAKRAGGGSVQRSAVPTGLAALTDTVRHGYVAIRLVSIVAASKKQSTDCAQLRRS